MSLRSHLRVALPTTLALGAFACAANRAYDVAATPPTLSSAMTSVPESGRTSAATAFATHADDPPLDDAQVAQLAVVANKSEVEQGRYAMGHARSARVRELARHTVSAHAAVDDWIDGVTRRERIVPAASPGSGALTAAVHSSFDDLQSRSSSAFDKAYVDAQVKGQRAVLELLDSRLIPNARDDGLKADLRGARNVSAELLDEALRVQKTLGK